MSLIAVEATWEYQTAANTVPGDPATVTVPSGGWTAGGVAPFGTIGGFAPEYAINTAWAVNTGLWIRRNVTLDGLAAVLVKGRCEQALYMYFDGTYVGALNPSNTSREDIPLWYIIIPKTLCTSGSHTIALFCLDESGGSADTTYIYAEADYLPPMLSIQPQAPVREDLEWLSDIIPSNDGTEDPLQIRLSPRQYFHYSYPVSAIEQARAVNVVRGTRGRQWVVPVWTQAQHIGSVTSGALTLTATTDYSEFRSSSLALLWQSTDVWQVVGIDTVSVGSLVLTTRTETFTNAYLMPLRFGITPGNPSRKHNGYNSMIELAFTIEDNAAITVSAPTQYLSNDIYYDEGLLDGDTTSEDIVADLDIFDPGLGKFTYYNPWLNQKGASTYRAIAEGASESWDLRKWLHRRAGRYRRFWQPTFCNDLRLESTGTLTTSIQVSADEYRRLATDRTHIAVETSSGWLPRAITSTSQVDADTIQLNLDTSLGGIAASSVKRISFLGLKRLNTDRIEINWIGGGVCEMAARVLEISP